MSDFFDKLTKQGKALWESAVSTASDLAESAKETANDLIDQGKDKAEELKLKGQQKDLFLKLGELVFNEAVNGDRKSTRLNSSHSGESRMPSSA